MDLERTVKNLPKQPGVYQYFDKDGKLLYVGKAKNLSNRVKSYFYFSPFRPNPNLSARISKMIHEATSLEYIVVQSEHDALLLENSLIKQLHPKYNILLRDDKTYPYIYIDKSQEYPRVDITRKVLKTKAIEYFGPYSIGARDIVDSIYDLCKLVQKKSCLNGKKACLFYQIDKCLAPCEFDVPKKLYDQELNKAIKYIKDKKSLLKELEKKMAFLAEQLRFEEAKEIRDRIEKIKRSSLHSDIDFATKENYDIFVVTTFGSKAIIVRVFMRDGKIISSDHTIIKIKENFDEEELLSQALLNFYAHTKPPIVADILTNVELGEKEILERFLQKELQKRIKILTPKRGAKKQLIELALLNAKEIDRQSNTQQNETLASLLQELFKLTHLPERIEVFDNSHMMGQATVGAMVVWDNGKKEKTSYRHYHLQAKDEYSQMQELLTRRAKDFASNAAPDLWVIDGGATLLKLADEIIKSSGANIDVIAIAKEKIDAKAHRAKGKARDIIYTLDETFKLDPDDKRLQFIQKLRDEAHRFAITFHKKTKLKQDQASKLLELHGISQAKIKKLLNYFGTFEAIKNATFEEICTILNKKDAKIIKNSYT